MAKQFCPYYSEELRGAYYDGFMKASKLVAQHEREACAQFIETGYVRQFENPWRDDLSAAIRARGQA
jgi:hypothetical protein